MGSTNNCLNSLIRSCLNLLFLLFFSHLVTFQSLIRYNYLACSVETNLLLLSNLLWFSHGLELSQSHSKDLVEIFITQVQLLRVWFDTLWELTVKFLERELLGVAVDILSEWVVFKSFGDCCLGFRCSSCNLFWIFSKPSLSNLWFPLNKLDSEHWWLMSSFNFFDDNLVFVTRVVKSFKIFLGTN